MSTIQTSPTLKSVFGASMVGVTLSAVVFGLLTMQVWTYFRKFPKDMLPLKCLVVAAWTVQAFQVATSTHMVYFYLVDNFGTFKELSVATWDYCLYLGQVSAAAIITQMFLVWRLFLLSQHWAPRYFICVSAVSLSLLSFSTGLFIMAKALEVKKFAAFLPYTWAVDLWLGSASAADLIIALSMCYYLHKSRTQIKSTDNLIRRLQAYSMQTGALTSLSEVFCLITFTITHFHYGHVVLVFPLGGFYAASLVANLNARYSSSADRHGRGGNSNTHVFELNSTGTGKKHGASNPSGHSGGTDPTLGSIGTMKFAEVNPVDTFKMESV